MVPVKTDFGRHLWLSQFISSESTRFFSLLLSKNKIKRFSTCCNFTIFHMCAVLVHAHLSISCTDMIYNCKQSKHTHSNTNRRYALLSVACLSAPKTIPVCKLALSVDSRLLCLVFVVNDDSFFYLCLSLSLQPCPVNLCKCNAPNEIARQDTFTYNTNANKIIVKWTEINNNNEKQCEKRQQQHALRLNEQFSRRQTSIERSRTDRFELISLEMWEIASAIPESPTCQITANRFFIYTFRSVARRKKETKRSRTIDLSLSRHHVLNICKCNADNNSIQCWRKN